MYSPVKKTDGEVVTEAEAREQACEVVMIRTREDLCGLRLEVLPFGESVAARISYGNAAESKARAVALKTVIEAVSHGTTPGQ